MIDELFACLVIGEGCGREKRRCDWRSQHPQSGVCLGLAGPKQTMQPTLRNVLFGAQRKKAARFPYGLPEGIAGNRDQGHKNEKETDP